MTARRRRRDRSIDELLGRGRRKYSEPPKHVRVVDGPRLAPGIVALPPRRGVGH